MTTFRSDNGAAWLDLLATLLGRYRDQQTDQIDSPVTLRAWLRENAIEPAGAVTVADVERAAALREALHRTAVAALHAERPRATDVRIIQNVLDEDEVVRVRATGRDGLTVNRPSTAAQALARLARDAVQDLSGARRTDLHACGDDSCSSIFLDHSGRRRWCSDERCGNRMRVQAHRARREASSRP